MPSGVAVARHRVSGATGRQSTGYVPVVHTARSRQGSIDLLGAACSRRLVLAILVVLCTTLAASGLSSAPALALETHVFSASFSGSGADALSDPQGVAIDQSTGEVYVVDSARNRVEIFSAAGVFISAFGTAGSGNGQFEEPTQVTVDDSAAMPGDVYVLDGGNERIEVFNASGAYQSQITTADLAATSPSRQVGSFEGVAVDAGGNLWIYDSNANLYEFPAGGVGSGRYVFNTSYGVTPGLAIDSSGDFYVLRGEPYVEKFGPSGTDLAEFDLCGCAAAVTVDPMSDDVFVDHGTSVAHFLASNASGTPSDSFGSTGPSPLVQGTGIAVRGLSGTVYVADAASNSVDIFVPATLPDVTTEAPASVSTTTEMLHGTVNPDEIPVTACQFEYGTEAGLYPHTIACSPTPGSGGASVAVSAQASGLAPNTTYHFRLAATNGQGTNRGETAAFTTSGPPVILSESAEATGQTMAKFGAQINPGGAETRYDFEYGPTASYGTTAPIPDGTIAAGFAEEDVAVEPTSLMVGTTYHFRVVAVNSNSPTPVYGADQTVTTVPSALIAEERVAEVSSESATLNAEISSLGNETHYYFQYGTSSCDKGSSSCTDAPMPPGPGIGLQEHKPVSTHLQNLTAEMTYHYRVVATNTLGTSYGPELTFRTQPRGEALALPDGRAWEMVSPPNKESAIIEPINGEGEGGSNEAQGGVIKTSEDGNAITYLATAPIGETEGNIAPDADQIFAARGPAGWATETLTAPRTEEAEVGVNFGGKGSEYKLFSQDLSLGLVEPPTRSLLSSEATEGTIYLRDAVGRDYFPLVTAANTPPGTKLNGTFLLSGVNNPYDVGVVGGSPDLSHVILESTAALTSNAVATGTTSSLYEWAGGRLQLVSVLPNDKPANTEEDQQAYIGSVTEQEAKHVSSSRNAVSEDGSRVIWNTGKEHHLYMWDATRGESVQIDAAQGVKEPSGAEPKFQIASSDGSKVFFADGEKLTAGATANGAGEPNLYEFEVTSSSVQSLAGKLTDLTVDAPNAGTSVIGASEDGAYVYTEGSSSAVLLHDTGTGWSNTAIPGEVLDSPESSHEGRARVSPDGRYLAFESADSVDLYDASTNHVVCVSCNPTGELPTGGASRLPQWTENGGDHGSGEGKSSQSRYLLDSGQLFFETSEALVPQDTNGEQDVYEYEPKGVGNCEGTSKTFSEASLGCVGLISSGASPQESSFLEASDSGDDVFFLTKERLLPRDTDNAVDIYDAHVCSISSPCMTTSVAPPACTTTDSCKAAPALQPTIFGAAGSATFSGAGNIAPAIVAPAVKAMAKHSSRVGKLAKALEACKKKQKGKRGRCEAQARKRLAAKPKAKKLKAKKSLSGRTRR